MGFWGEHVVPRWEHSAGGNELLESVRRRVCSGLSGAVVEIGFGSGPNVQFYPAAVTRVAAVEPSDVAWRLAAERLRRATTPVERAGLDAQLLPFADGTFDAALSTWSMCTIPDPAAALGELRRVLRPGAEFHFVEHGLAPDDRVRVWQRRVEPIWKRVAGGCHLTRPIKQLLVDAGFTLLTADAFYEAGTPKIAGADTVGVAVVPGGAGRS